MSRWFLCSRVHRSRTTPNAESVTLRASSTGGRTIQQQCPGEGNYKISIDTKVKPTSVRTTKPLPLFRVQTDPAERLNPLPTWHSVQRVSLWGGGLLQQSVPHTSSSHGSSWMAFLSASDGRRVGLTASKMNYVLLCQPVVRDRDGSIRFNRRCFRQPRVVRSSSAC